MNKVTFLIIVLCAAFAAGCETLMGPPTPVEYTGVCDKANDDKLVEFTAYFNNTGSAMCSKSGNEPMRCPVDIAPSPGGEKKFRGYIDKGTGPSSIDNPGEKGLKITDDNGEVVENTQKVKITAEVKVFDEASKVGDPNSDACYLTVKKIEKQ